MNELVIAPSILSLDFSNMKEQIDELNNSKAAWLHYDVMDGHFAPNLTFGPDILKAVRKSTDKVLDVHLMVEDPEFFIPIFASAGADMITFHVEALNQNPVKIAAVLKQIHDLNKKAGFVINPATDIRVFEDLLDQTDMILIMSVNPGFSGQKFMPEVLSKIEWLKEKRDEKNLDFRIEIDGGINDRTVIDAKKAGADTIVAGSYVFLNGILESVDKLLSA